ncbi:MAG: integrase arm-type DNA-binding domain-containing protein [Chromatiaceae bacterium]|nr:integrase arm-type DNA-binding domain-containing protein [Chromatiaceae bacterium]MCF8002867.1 integrase arm-type DNA-binding domain-containing protein [Chromatiaceae bacterium]
MGKLTSNAVKAAAPGKHEDGEGLRLVVTKTGSRKWVLRYQLSGRRREMGLGTYPAVSLKLARDKAAQARSQAAQGVDPISARAKVETTTPTFTQAAARFIRSKRHEWSNRKHARQWAATIRTYAKPVIGQKPVDTITTEQVLAILQPLWTSRTETAKRVQGRIENILDFASAMKWRDQSNPARWRGHLDKLLPSATKVKRQQNGGTTRHHPAMPYSAVPGFMSELQQLGSVSALALQFTILTAARTSEVLLATWSEVDLEAAIWTIPASRTKARREHRVPLTEAAMAVLRRVPRVEGNNHIFTGARQGRPLSNMAMLQVMRGLGYGVNGDRGDYVPHGFRSGFRDWAGEVSSFPRDVCEMALGHVIESKVEAAYRRGDLFEKRRRMMSEWAEWCGKGTEKNVVNIHQQQQRVSA